MSGLARTIALLAVASGWLLLSNCSRQQPPSSAPGKPPDPVESSPSDVEAQTIAPPTFLASLPHPGGTPGYASSKACRSCHQDEYESWHRSYHRSMTQIAIPDAVQANFQNVTLTNEDTRFILSRTNNQFWVHMERPGPASLDSDRPALDVRLGLLTGSHHMQVFWVPAGGGNIQVGFPFTWLIPEKKWVPRNSTFVRPPDMPHRSEVWNVVCSRCHATGVQPRIDSATRTMDTQVGELGIACEACHGPGQRHVKAREADHTKGIRADPKIVRTEIVHPKKIDPVRAGQICGFCHSMKWFDKSEDWRKDGFHFRPGDDLELTTPIIQPSRAGSIPGLAEYLARNPDLFRDFFWPDGMIRVSGREYNGLLASPCYKGGKFSCLACHSLHESEPDMQLAKSAQGNAACTQCHPKFRDAPTLTAHTHHGADSSGSECYNCHMPFTTYGVLKGIRSHQISSPTVAAELATGRPNACNLCHLDKSLAWAAEHLAAWSHQPVPDLSADQHSTADSVRLALQGDAGQRVLIAWGFSWEPALKTAGKSWIPPVLGRLLDDPYAAVRCVAERSLRQIDPALVPAGYDFTLENEIRPAAEKEVIARWSKANTSPGNSEFPEATRVTRMNTNAMENAFDRLVQQRDNRPVRLRE